MCFKGPRARCLVRAHMGHFLSSLMQTSEEIIYLSFEVKLNVIFHFHRYHWSGCCPSWNHRIILIIRNSFECTLTDWTSLWKVSTSRWQYDTWIWNFPNQDSSIITKNKQPDYSIDILKYTIKFAAVIIYKVVYFTIIIIFCCYKHLFLNAKRDLASLSQYRIKAFTLQPWYFTEQ